MYVKVQLTSSKKRFKIFVDVKTLCYDVNAPEKVASVPKDKHYQNPLSALVKFILTCLQLFNSNARGWSFVCEFFVIILNFFFTSFNVVKIKKNPWYNKIMFA